VRLALRVAPAQRLLLLVRGELGLAPELDSLRLGGRAASRRALADAPQLELGRDPEAGRD
jgi:hypothetical protein